MGLYNYPVLMAADILLMDSDVVPVGKDQSQHVEYAAEIASSFNHLFGAHHKLKIPQLVLDALMEPGGELDDVLTAGAERARARARVVLMNVREATGIQ